MKGESPPVTVKELKEKVGDETTKVGQGNAFKNGWIAKEGDGFVKKVRVCSLPSRVELMSPKVPSITDATQLEVREVDSTGTLKSGEKGLVALRKRKLIAQKCGIWIMSSPLLSDLNLGRANGSRYTRDRGSALQSKSWKRI